MPPLSLTPLRPLTPCTVPSKDLSRQGHAEVHVASGGPLMARWHAEQQEAHTLRQRHPSEESDGDKDTAPPWAQMAFRSGIADALVDAARCEAQDVIRALRKPVAARLQPGLTAVKRALSDWDAIRRGALPHVIEVHGKVVLSASGLSVIEDGRIHYREGYTARTAAYLGPLVETADTFVAHTRRNLAAVIAEAHSSGLGHQIRCSPVVPLEGRAPLSDVGIMSLVALTPCCVGAISYCSNRGVFVSLWAGFVGFAIAATAAASMTDLAGGKDVGQSPTSVWRAQVHGGMREEDAIDVAAGDAWPEHPTDTQLPRFIRRTHQALQQELQRRYVAEPTTGVRPMTHAQLKAVLSQHIEPVRRRARHLLTLLRSPQLFEGDEIVADLRRSLAALDQVDAEHRVHQVFVLQGFAFTASGFVWCPPVGEGLHAFAGDDGAAMALAQIELSDHDFVQEVRCRLHASASALHVATPEGVGCLQRTHERGRALPHPQWRGMLWLHKAQTAAARVSIGAALGACVGALLAAPFGQSHPAAACAGGVIGAGLSTWRFVGSDSASPDAHDVTLAWYKHHFGDATMAQLPCVTDLDAAGCADEETPLKQT